MTKPIPGAKRGRPANPSERRIQLRGSLTPTTIEWLIGQITSAPPEHYHELLRLLTPPLQRRAKALR